MTDAKYTGPHLLAIGGIYMHRNTRVRLLSVYRNELRIQLLVIADIKFPTTQQIVGAEEIIGPTHVPCPRCGELKVLDHPMLGIDLAEHLDRCRIYLESRKAECNERA